eukprot:14443634-Heterocapsa_arctica.AAC.1
MEGSRRDSSSLVTRAASRIRYILVLREAEGDAEVVEVGGVVEALENVAEPRVVDDVSRNWPLVDRQLRL